MVEAVPFDTMFFSSSPFKNQLSVKLPSNTVGSGSSSASDTSASIASMFEVFGAVELAKMTREDMVSGIGLSYELVGEIDDITKEITAKMLRSTNSTNKSKSQLDISQYISPVDLTDSDLPGIMIDDKGDLNISLLKLASDEVIEVQALTGGRVINIEYGLDEQ